MSSSPLESGVGQRRQAKSDSLWRGLVFPLHQPPLSLLHSLARHACNMGCMNPKSSNFIYVGPTDRKGAWQSGPRYPAPRTGEQLDDPPIKSLESERGWLLRAFGPAPNGLISPSWERSLERIVGALTQQRANNV